MEGDKVFGIRSFSVRMGQKKVILKEDATCLLLFSGGFAEYWWVTAIKILVC